VFDVEKTIGATPVPSIASRPGIAPQRRAVPPVPPVPPAVPPAAPSAVPQQVSPPVARRTRPRTTPQVTISAPPEPLLEHAVRYVKERHWEVLPGTWLEFAGGVPRCSCAVQGCDTPGAHPTRPDWTTQATGSVSVVRRLWAAEPRAAILLPAGRTFDLLEVPETAGCLALARMERMGTTLGPVSSTPTGRMMFFVLAGGAAKTPGLLRQLGWSAAGMDLMPRGEGEYVAAPPTRTGPRGSAQWVREPTTANRWLPDAEELMPTLAYACAQDRQDRQHRQDGSASR
jgi:hypothetical protein